MEGAFRDLHFGIMSTFVNVKIVRFAVIVNKDRNNSLPVSHISSVPVIHLHTTMRICSTRESYPQYL